jgi:hypothetical protein
MSDSRVRELLHINYTTDFLSSCFRVAATDVTAIEDLPGSFNSSMAISLDETDTCLIDAQTSNPGDTYLNDLWAAGARTVQLGCTSKGSLAPAWQVRFTSYV